VIRGSWLVLVARGSWFVRGFRRVLHCPVVLFVYNHFERAARAQANGPGVPDLKVYVFPQYKPGEAYSPEEAEKAVKAAAEFPQLLLGTSG
jgi:hypothetical protein